MSSQQNLNSVNSGMNEMSTKQYKQQQAALAQYKNSLQSDNVELAGVKYNQNQQLQGVYKDQWYLRNTEKRLKQSVGGEDCEMVGQIEEASKMKENLKKMFFILTT